MSSPQPLFVLPAGDPLADYEVGYEPHQLADPEFVYREMLRLRRALFEHLSQASAAALPETGRP